MFYRRRLMTKPSVAIKPVEYQGVSLYDQRPRSWIRSVWDGWVLKVSKSGGTYPNDLVTWVPAHIHDHTALGWDVSKKRRIRIRVKAKYGVYGEGVGTIQFALYNNMNSSQSPKESEIRVARELKYGDEFIIPIDGGEVVDNLRLRYNHLTNDGSGVDGYQFDVYFNVYFEEITE